MGLTLVRKLGRTFDTRQKRPWDCPTATVTTGQAGSGTMPVSLSWDGAYTGQNGRNIRVTYWSGIIAGPGCLSDVPSCVFVSPKAPPSLGLSHDL